MPKSWHIQEASLQLEWGSATCTNPPSSIVYIAIACTSMSMRSSRTMTLSVAKLELNRQNKERGSVSGSELSDIAEEQDWHKRSRSCISAIRGGAGQVCSGKQRGRSKGPMTMLANVHVLCAHHLQYCRPLLVFQVTFGTSSTCGNSGVNK